MDLRNLFKTEIISLNKTNYSSSLPQNTQRNKLKFKSKQERFNEKIKQSKDVKEHWAAYRKAAGLIWVDPTMEEWDKNDFRIFVGNLGNEVDDEILKNSFAKYSSLLKAKIIKDKLTNKSKGYGFVSLKNESDYILAMNEMDGKYIGNRPALLKRSTWKERTVKDSKSQLKEWHFAKNTSKALNQLKNNRIKY